MKKFAIIALAAIAASVSCQKVVPENEAALQNGPKVFKAGIVQNDTKAALSIMDNIAKINWEAGDEITVIDALGSGSFFVLTEGAGTPYGTFEQDLERSPSPIGAGPYFASYGSSDLSTQLYSPENSVPKLLMTAESVDDYFSFTAQDGILKINLKDADRKVSKIVIPAPSDQALALDTELICNDVVDISTAKDFLIVLAPGTYSKVCVYDEYNRCSEKDLNVEVLANHVYPVKSESLSFYGLGPFSVSETDVVFFSEGNLWADNSAPSVKWHFESNQYSYPTDRDPSHIGYFWWSPMESIACGDGSGVYPETLTNADILFTNKPGYSMLPNPAFTVDGKSGVWRSMTVEDWTYLLETRNLNVSFRYTDAVTAPITIESVQYKGMFLYPDDYDGSEVSSSMTWADIKAANIVFLPAAGVFTGGSQEPFTNVGYDGCYWAAECDMLGPEDAKVMNFSITPTGSSFSVELTEEPRGSAAFNIRLVLDAYKGV